MKLLIKNGKIIDPTQKLEEKGDIYIENGKIKDIGRKLDIDCEHEIDATGKFVFPGFIDMHTHLREPGYEYKEDIETGTKAAAAGGITSVACMANTDPINDNEGVTSFILDKASKVAKVNVFPIGAITKGIEGKELAELGYISEAGGVGFSDDGYAVSSSLVLRRALEYQKIIKKILIEHAEDISLSGEGVANESPYTYKLGLSGIPSASESVIIGRDIEIVKQIGGKLHFAHLSSRWSVEQIKTAKKIGLNITAEVTPHHLLLNERVLEKYSTNYKMNPPLRTEQDRQSLIEGIKDGTIDVIASDHAPHTEDEKELEFDYAPFGVIGLETTAGVVFDRLVMSGVIDLKRYTELLSVNPAKILQLNNKGSLQKGKDADITIIDPNKRVKVDPEKFMSKAKNSSFIDWEIKGWPVYTIVGGEIVHGLE